MRQQMMTTYEAAFRIVNELENLGDERMLPQLAFQPLDGKLLQQSLAEEDAIGHANDGDIFGGKARSLHADFVDADHLIALGQGHEGENVARRSRIATEKGQPADSRELMQ